MLGWEDGLLEVVHDYIQWWFPIRAPSRHNAPTPIVNDRVASTFARRPDVRERQLAALDRMLRFYGYARVGADVVEDTRSHRWTARTRNWLRPGDHNLARISRILASLHELAQPELALAFHERLLDLRATEEGRNAVTPPIWRVWGENAGDV